MPYAHCRGKCNPSLVLHIADLLMVSIVGYRLDSYLAQGYYPQLRSTTPPIPIAPANPCLEIPAVDFRKITQNPLERINSENFGNSSKFNE